MHGAMDFGIADDGERAGREQAAQVARRTASRWWPLTCRSRPSAMWRLTGTSFDGYRAPESTDRLLG
jgi:hypothetical protein